MRRGILFMMMCCVALGLHAQIQVLRKLGSRPEPVKVSVEATALLDKQASELMANYLSPAKMTGELATIKTDIYHEQVSRESLQFPADELYNSNWDTIHVNPFSSSNKVMFPDTYTIDCRSFTLPIDNDIKVTSKYGIRRRRMHHGTDLKITVGDTIRAAFDGKVRIKSFERRGFGYYLVLRHPNGLETVYGHLSKFLVKENQIVRAGDAIGLGGNTGRSTGSHLHFETRFLGRNINPEEIIDFENGVPYKDEYVFHNIKVNGKSTNTYATSADAVAVHRVKKGETLSQIALMYGTTVSELCTLNGITKSSTLAIGQAIRFRSKQVTVEATASAIKQVTPEKSQSPTASNQTASTQASTEQAVPSGPVYHSIEPGDTLYSLAKKYGTTVEKICELNDFNENIIIKIGQRIRCS